MQAKQIPQVLVASLQVILETKLVCSEMQQTTNKVIPPHILYIIQSYNQSPCT